MESGPLLKHATHQLFYSVISRFELNCSVNVAHACSQWCHSTLRFNTIYRFFMETVKCTIVVGGVWSNGHLRRTIELSFWAYAKALTDHKLSKWNFWWHFQHVFFRLLKNTFYKTNSEALKRQLSKIQVAWKTKSVCIAPMWNHRCKDWNWQ